jgi:ribosomal protein S18 acetylase RimI-like enzyme
MRIVRATRRHVPSVAELMASSPLLRRYRVTRAGATASLNEGLRADDLLLVAIDGGSVVGLAWLINTRALDGSGYLRLLLVAEGRQSRGLGAALLARGEREVRASGARHLVMLVTRSNRRARSFYERQGYGRVADLPGFVRRGIDESLYLKTWKARASRS